MIDMLINEEEIENLESERAILRQELSKMSDKERESFLIKHSILNIKDKFQREFEIIYYDSVKELKDTIDVKIDEHELNIISKLFNIIKTKI